MLNMFRQISLIAPISHSVRKFSASSVLNKTYSCKVLVIGGGSGGCTIAAKFARRLGKDAVIIIEPSAVHYYQPLFTLVGAGVKTVGECRRMSRSVLPSKAVWMMDRAVCIDPQGMQVSTEQGHTVNYEYVVVAVGMKYDYHKVPGLKEALDDADSGVSTIYSPDYCEKTWCNLQEFQGGNAIFTFPNTNIKCPGAPQKIAYLADAYFRKKKVRSKANIMYNTNLPVIFGVKKYADALLKVVKRKGICVNYQNLLLEVHHERKQAVFLDVVKESCYTLDYGLLHVTPPMSTPALLSENPGLTDAAGYLDVDMYTLQHKKYSNIYGIGDCTSTPNSKTAAAVARQSYVLEMNLLNTMKKNEPTQKYDGYGACPLVTSYHTCIIAEFLYNGVPRETLPINQARESLMAFYMKKDLFPFLYWNFMLKGRYHGPEAVRRIINPFAHD